jgi:toxin ParE1/3/4
VARYSVRYLPAAAEDIDEIVDYLVAEDINAAQSFVDGLDAIERQLSEYPHSGSKPKDRRLAGKGYRFMTVCGYLAFYTTRENIVWMMRVLHGRRDYARWL